MSKLSREEKRTRLLALFHDGQEFYQLKELEKMAKDKGINQNQVKEILQQLVDDSLVDSDKIGPSLYYWSFPNKMFKLKRKQLSDLKDSKEMLKCKLATMEAVLKSQQETQNDSDKLKRDSLVNAIESLKAQEKDLLDYVKKNEAMDPKKAEKLESDVKVLTLAANRWTDNIFAVKSWCNKKFNIDERDLNKHFSIPDDLDYFN